MLYNWRAATNNENTSTDNQGQGQSTEGPATHIQGICPANWHVPSDKEWNELEAVFAGNDTEYTNSNAQTFPWLVSYSNTTVNAWRPDNSKGFGHGKSMKSPCPPVGAPEGSHTNGDSKIANNGGFAFPLSGFGSLGNIANFGTTGYLWSSSYRGGTVAWSRSMDDAHMGVQKAYASRAYLYSVRCKKN